MKSFIKFVQEESEQLDEVDGSAKRNRELHATGRISKDEFNRRMDICKACPFFVVRTQQCRKCGCFMKLKTKLERASCPIKKW